MTATMRINAYALLRMVLPVDGAKLIEAEFERDAGGFPVLRLTVDGEGLPETGELAPVYREIEGLSTADGHRCRAYVLERLHSENNDLAPPPQQPPSNQGCRGAGDDSRSLETPAKQERAP